ncbi:hypothetical protein CAEBREN_12168 [Caenorhabditis brenneri]|uniref:Uncharacterized protein n=1 Tax=Caenorhabditis brenneri TaxID=135651 RepID=G0MHQ4_CAEBE|nr:hypothetical protein CAEBREN_12168 [Caenorhabditis brenneri]
MNTPLRPSPPVQRRGPGHLGIPISDDSSEDEQSQIRALEEEQGIYYHKEVYASPKNESDDDIPQRRFQLNHPAVIQKLQDFASQDHTVEEENEIENPAGASAPNMERRRSVRFSGPHDEEEDGRNKHFRTPSPESLRYIQVTLFYSIY